MTGKEKYKRLFKQKRVYLKYTTSPFDEYLLRELNTYCRTIGPSKGPYYLKNPESIGLWWNDNDFYYVLCYHILYPELHTYSSYTKLKILEKLNASLGYYIYALMKDGSYFKLTNIWYLYCGPAKQDPVKRLLVDTKDLVYKYNPYAIIVGR